MDRRSLRAFLASVVAAAVLAFAGAARAQEIELTGPLKGAPAVRHMRLYRQGRFELAPSVSFTLLDQYRRTILFGARLNYNITDWLAIGVWGSYGAISTTTDLTDRIDGGPNSPNPGQGAPRDKLTATNVNHSGGTPGMPAFGYKPFADQTARLNWVLVPQLTFTPFRGKLAIFNKIFVDTDLFITAGPSFMGIEERANCGESSSEPACDLEASFARKSTTKIFGTASIGLTFYPSEFWSLGVEYRALPFWWNLAGFDSRGSGPGNNFPDFKVNSEDETFHFNQLVTITIGFSFPTRPRISD
jgi:hypothetical protein